MNTHTCGDKVYIAWERLLSRPPRSWNNIHRTDSVSAGRVSTFRSSADGTLTLESDRDFPECSRMGAITTTADCGAVAVLCGADKNWTIANMPGTFKKDWVEELCTPLFAVHGHCGGLHDYYAGELKPDGTPYCTDHCGVSNKNMWLYEWADGVVTTEPSSAIIISKSIGGANYGHWELAMTNDDTIYNFQLKSTWGGHELSMGDAIYRANWTWARDRILGMTCGGTGFDTNFDQLFHTLYAASHQAGGIAFYVHKTLCLSALIGACNSNAHAMPDSRLQAATKCTTGFGTTGTLTTGPLSASTTPTVTAAMTTPGSPRPSPSTLAIKPTALSVIAAMRSTRPKF